MSEDNKTEVNNIKTKRKLLKPVHIFIILIAVIGTSFAYFLASGTINLGNITTSNIAMAFSSGENAIIANGIPLYDEEVETDAAYLIFSVKNTGTNTMYTNLYLENITMSSEIFKSEDFKWSLEEGSGITEYEFVTNVREVSSGNFLNIDETDSSNKKIHMARSIIIDGGATKYFKVRVWLSETGLDQTEFIKQSINLKVGATGYTEGDKILASNTLTLTNTIPNAVLRNVRMYGNSVQDGTPTPDAPIEIESVGDNVNILENKNTSGTINGVTFTKNADGSITMNGTNTGTNNIIYPINTDVGYAARDIALKAGTYTLSHRANLPSGIYVQAHYVDGGTTLYRTSTNSNGISFTISEDAIAGVYIRFDVGVTADNITIYPQLEKGSTVTSYVPYGKYKIPVVATSKNTFDEKFRIGSVSGTDTTRLYSTQILKIKAGETYTVSTNLDTNTYNYAVHTLKSAPPTGWDNIIVDSTWLTNKTYTFTTNVDCYIGIYIRKKDNSKISIDETADYWFQIEKGSSATTYEPYAESQTYNIYLNEPLRAIGSYRDYIDFDSGKVVRSVGKYVIDENTTWSEMQLGVVNSNYIYAYSTVLDKLAINNKLSILSISNKTSEHQGMWRESNYKNESQDVSFQTYGKLRLAILANRLENINKTSLSNWLKDNNIEVHYVLATQTEETIDLSSIKTLGNTTYIIVNTKIKPTLQGVY